MESGRANPRQVCRLAVYDQGRTAEGWFGYYGYVDWRSAFDWRR